MSKSLHEIYGGSKVLKCCNCKRTINVPENEHYFYVEDGFGRKVSGPYCSKECAPDVDSEEIERLGKAESGVSGFPWYLTLPLRLLATIWYIPVGGILQLIGLGLNNLGNVHGGGLGALFAFISLEKYAFGRMYNFYYR